VSVIVGTVELDCEVNSSLDYNWVQMISIALLISFWVFVQKKKDVKVVPKINPVRKIS